MKESHKKSLEVMTIMGNDRCPVCDKLLDRVSGPCKPDPGNISICIGCTAVLEFAPDMALVEMSDQKIAALPDDVRLSILKIRIAMIEVKTQAN